MNKNFHSTIALIHSWLKNDVYPLWSTKGIDRKYGGFIESLSFAGEDLQLPRRAMVQSRQIYSFRTGARMGCFPQQEALRLAHRGTEYMVDKFSLEDGAFRYSVENDGRPKNDMPDLYTQAFALFGLAQEYAISRDPVIKNRALKLEKYLREKRTVPTGGFTEVDSEGQVSYKSNPHMHMFESAIAWMSVDEDPIWKNLGADLIHLALEYFIDKETGILGEYFDERWNPLKENNVFVYEPGHQFEWAWLMLIYEELTGFDLKKTRHQLFLKANQYGTSPTRKVTFDEMWSDQKPKKISSRFWPQCERIKAAVRLGLESSEDQRKIYIAAADDAMETLFKFLQTPHPGMWYDQLSDTDTFSGDLSKSSSLYHIINAMEEYCLYRPKL